MDGERATRGAMLLDAGHRYGAEPGIVMRLLAPGFGKILDGIDAGLQTGSLHATLPDGTSRVLGGRAPGFEAHVALKDWRALVRLVTGGSIGWYQAWEAREWSSPDPVSLFALFVANAPSLGNLARAKGLPRIVGRALHWLNRNTPMRASRNIRQHYDLGNDFYAAWLDRTMSYSCAQFQDWGDAGGLRDMLGELEYAQLGKITSIVNRMAVPPGGTVLEIGCGWGALAHSATANGAHVTAINISDEQIASCQRRGLPKKGSIKFARMDYREVSGQFDGIASVEMVEALGREYWPGFMDCVERNLKPGGRAAIQFISIRDDIYEQYAANPDFIQAYVFPGGMLIKTSEFRELAEQRGLEWTDQVDFGDHYAQTLRHWRRKFDEADRDGKLPDGFDARFTDLWRYYLMYCEGGFLGGGIDVSQVTLIKPA